MRRSAKEILTDITAELEKIISIMKLDPNEQWSKHFERYLKDAKEIDRCGCKEEDVRELCSTIRSMSQGKAPFGDYFPSTFDPRTGRYTIIPGTEDYDQIRDRIFDLAEEIRTQGSY